MAAPPRRDPWASPALVPLALVLANLAGLAVSVLVPMLLSGAEYAIFALVWSLGQLLASLAYEWMRVCVMRFAVGAEAGKTAARRRALWRGYGATTAALLGAAALAAPALPQAPALAVVCLFAAGQGVFDGRQALARAEMDTGFFVRAWVLRSALGLVLGAAAAALTGQGLAAVAGLALSFPLAMMALRGLKVAGVSAPADPVQAGFLWRFGVYAALATNLSLAFPALARGVAAAGMGLEAAAGAMLALDLAQKAVAMVGLVVNLVMIQRSIRLAEFGAAADLPAQAGRQIAVTAVFVAPAALGFWLIRTPFADLVVPQGYGAAYAAVIGPAALAAGVGAFRLFGVDTLFVIRGQTRGAAAGPLVSLLVLAGVGGLAAEAGPAAFGWACAGAAVAGAWVALARARAAGPILWPGADLARVAAGCLAMIAVARLAPVSAGAAGMALQIAVCALAYGATALALNTIGLRAMIGARAGAR